MCRAIVLNLADLVADSYAEDDNESPRERVSLTPTEAKKKGTEDL
jgi:hypothetical protein